MLFLVPQGPVGGGPCLPSHLQQCQYASTPRFVSPAASPSVSRSASKSTVAPAWPSLGSDAKHHARPLSPPAAASSVRPLSPPVTAPGVRAASPRGAVSPSHAVPVTARDVANAGSVVNYSYPFAHVPRLISGSRSLSPCGQPAPGALHCTPPRFWLASAPGEAEVLAPSPNASPCGQCCGRCVSPRYQSVGEVIPDVAPAPIAITASLTAPARKGSTTNLPHGPQARDRSWSSNSVECHGQAAAAAEARRTEFRVRRLSFDDLDGASTTASCAASPSISCSSGKGRFSACGGRSENPVDQFLLASASVSARATRTSNARSAGDCGGATVGAATSTPGLGSSHTEENCAGDATRSSKGRRLSKGQDMEPEWWRRPYASRETPEHAATPGRTRPQSASSRVQASASPCQRTRARSPPCRTVPRVQASRLPAGSRVGSSGSSTAAAPRLIRSVGSNHVEAAATVGANASARSDRAAVDSCAASGSAVGGANAAAPSSSSAAGKPKNPRVTAGGAGGCAGRSATDVERRVRRDSRGINGHQGPRKTEPVESRNAPAPRLLPQSLLPKGKAASMSSRLLRFTEAQRNGHLQALRELQAGRKSTCWMWYIVPTPPHIVGNVERGSALNRKYALRSVDEVREYLRFEADGVNLRSNYLEIMGTVRDQLKRGKTALSLFGRRDEPKLRSSATLFEWVTRETTEGAIDDPEVHTLASEVVDLLEAETRRS